MTTKPEVLWRIPIRQELTVIAVCPVCREEFDTKDESMTSHFRKKGDLEHLAFEVMET